MAAKSCKCVKFIFGTSETARRRRAQKAPFVPVPSSDQTPKSRALNGDFSGWPENKNAPAGCRGALFYEGKYITLSIVVKRNLQKGKSFLTNPSAAHRSLARTAAQLAIPPGCRGFRRAFGVSACGAHLCGCPFLGAEKAREERGHVQIGVQRGKMKAQSRWTDFDGTELRRLGVLDPLRGLRSERYLHSGRKLNPDAPTGVVVARRNGSGFVLLHIPGPAIGEREFILGHECPSRPPTERATVLCKENTASQPFPITCTCAGR